MLGSLIGRLRERGITISKLQSLHPAIDRAVLSARRVAYTRKFFREGPKKAGKPGGKRFVLFNHCWDLDIESYLAADSPHELWVLDPFAMFTDVFHFFPPGQRDLQCVYGEGAMAASIERFKDAYIRDFARRLVREVKLDALLTPSDTFYYLRPLMEELRALGVPTIVQDKEGTIAPSDMMKEHARMLAERYPPMADHYIMWNDTVRDYWVGIGVAPEKLEVVGQPRSDFFFHEERWPAKSALGLTEGKKLVVAFTYDADVYLRTTEALPDRPWAQLRDDLHESVRQLARERPDVEVVVKAHPQAADLGELTAEFERHALPNVKFMAGASSASHLVVRADVVVGFQSTVMIEAMLLGRPVIYAGWGPYHDKVEAGLVPIHRSGGCLLPQSRAELDRQLRDALDGKLAPSPEMMRKRRAFTDRYFYEADGNACARILDAAARFVTSRR